MHKPSPLETRLYLAAMALVFFVTCIAISYLDGRAAEIGAHRHEHDTLLSACRENNFILQKRYDSLADNTDAVTVIAAEAKYQGAGQ